MCGQRVAANGEHEGSFTKAVKLSVPVCPTISRVPHCDSAADHPNNANNTGERMARKNRGCHTLWHSNGLFSSQAQSQHETATACEWVNSDSVVSPPSTGFAPQLQCYHRLDSVCIVVMCGGDSRCYAAERANVSGHVCKLVAPARTPQSRPHSVPALESVFIVVFTT